MVHDTLKPVLSLDRLQ